MSIRVYIRFVGWCREAQGQFITFREQEMFTLTHNKRFLIPPRTADVEINRATDGLWLLHKNCLAVDLQVRFARQEALRTQHSEKPYIVSYTAWAKYACSKCDRVYRWGHGEGKTLAVKIKCWKWPPTCMWREDTYATYVRDFWLTLYITNPLISSNAGRCVSLSHSC